MVSVPEENVLLLERQRSLTNDDRTMSQRPTVTANQGATSGL